MNGNLTLKAMALASFVFCLAPGLHAGDCDDDPTVAPFLKALKGDSKNLDHQYNLAIAYYKKVAAIEPGQPNPCLDDAINAFRKYTKSARNSKSKELADAYSVLGILEFQFKDNAEDGAEAFKEALALRPEDKDSLYGISLALKKLGRLEEAVGYLKKTVLVDQSNLSAAYTLAIAQNTIFGDKPAKEQVDELVKSFEAAVKLAARNKSDNKDILIASYNRLSELYSAQGNIPKAISVLNKAIEIEPNDFNAHGQLGLLYHKDKNYLKMVEEYEKAVEIQPDQELARFNLAVAYINQEQFAKAYDQFKYIADKINPGNSEVLALQGQTLERALTELKTAGGAAMASEDFLTAATNFQKVLSLDPKDREAQKFMAQAEDKLEAAFKGFLNESKAKLKKGRKLDAAESVEKALALKPEDADALALKDKIGADISQLVKLYISKGDEAMKAKNYFLAEEQYKKALPFPSGKKAATAKLAAISAKFKGNFDAAMKKAKAAFSRGDYVTARNEYKKARATKPGDKAAEAGFVGVNIKIDEVKKKAIAKGEELFNSGKKGPAQKEFERVLALDPTNATANDYIKRMTGSESTAKVNADQVKQLYYKGVDLYVNNKIDKAIDTWEELLKLDPNHEDAKKNIQRAKTKLQALKKLG